MRGIPDAPGSPHDGGDGCVSVAPPPAGVAPPTPGGAVASPRRAERPAANRVLDPALTRLAAFAALAAFVAVHWSALVVPGALGDELLAMAACVGAAAALSACRYLPGDLRMLAGAAVAVLGLVLVLLAVGTPAHLLAPWQLVRLASDLRSGVDALPNARIPYGDPDQWTRRAIELGGPLLLGLSAVASFWPRRATPAHGAGRVVAVATIVTAYTAVAVNVKGDAEFLRGTLFFFLLAAFLALERVPRRDLPPAAMLTALAALAGLVLAPALQQSKPWLDYEGVARTLGRTGGERFNWNQTYGPLDWPRVGRTLLEVKAAFPAYWKAEALDSFDGRAWVEDRHPPANAIAAELPADAATLARWTQQLHVTLGSLDSPQFIAAGTITAISRAPRQPLDGASVGSFRAAGDGLHDGHSYDATVYTPAPDSATLMAASASNYPATFHPYLRLQIPRAGSGTLRRRKPPTTPVSFTPFVAGAPPSGSLASSGASAASPSADALVAASPYARAWALVAQLRARTSTPADYVDRVLAYLQRGFSYTEDTPLRSWPLERFLFDTRQGYCQQFSGSMALLLRMGGIPARVAVGFTTGQLDRRRGVYVVSDADAHAWVEAWFAGVGWVPFDPTPATAPARGGTGAPADLTPPRGRRPSPVPRPTPSGPAPTPRQATHGGAPWGLIGGALAGLLAAMLAGVAFARRTRLWLVRRPAGDARLRELERALRICGVEPWSGLTLTTLAARLSRAPIAAAYIAALADARYRRADGDHGVRSLRSMEANGRRALRRELGRGHGPLARLRLLFALPPRPPR